MNVIARQHFMNNVKIKKLKKLLQLLIKISQVDIFNIYINQNYNI